MPWRIGRVPDVLGASPADVRQLSSAAGCCALLWKGQEGKVAQKEVRAEDCEVLIKEEVQEKVQGHLLCDHLRGQQVLSCTPRSSGPPGLVGELPICEQLAACLRTATTCAERSDEWPVGAPRHLLSPLLI